MNKKKSKLGIIFIILGIVLIIFGIIYTNINTGNTDNNSKDDVKDDFKYSEQKKITNCKTSNCPTEEYTTYAMISYDTNIKEIQDIIKKINNETKKYYNEVNESDTTDSSCEQVKDIYHHRLKVNTVIYHYTNDKYITISVNRRITDVCTNESNMLQTETYIYDFKQEKILTQDEFKNKENITDNQIYNSIKNQIEIVNKIDETNYQVEDHYDDVVVFYNNSGDLVISYHRKETSSYMTATLIK